MRTLTVQYVSHQKSPLMKSVRQGAFDYLRSLLSSLCLVGINSDVKINFSILACNSKLMPIKIPNIIAGEFS